MKDSINYFAVAVSAIVSLLISAVWFMVIFRETYIIALGKTKEQMDKGPSGPAAMAMQLAGNFVMALVLVWLMKKLDYYSPLDGIKLAFIAWVGFVAAVLAPMYAFQAYSLVFFFITAGSVLLSMLATGAILGTWH